MRPIIATIDLTAIRHNYALAKRCAPGRRALAVVKADAYGHGSAALAAALREEADGFAACSAEEARVVREQAPEARLLLLEGRFAAEDYAAAMELGLHVSVQGAEQAQRLLDCAPARARNVRLGLDSGMHRLGVEPAELQRWAERVRGAAQVAEVNRMSRFSCGVEHRHVLPDHQ